MGVAGHGTPEILPTCCACDVSGSGDDVSGSADGRLYGWKKTSADVTMAGDASERDVEACGDAGGEARVGGSSFTFGFFCLGVVVEEMISSMYGMREEE